jgi:hypothetical protein
MQIPITIMSYQNRIVRAQGGGGGNLVAILYQEIKTWDKLLHY